MRHLVPSGPLAADAGAQALVGKDRFIRELPQVLPQLARGLPYPEHDGFLSVRDAFTALQRQQDETADTAALSRHEREILNLYAQNYSTVHIARLLHVTENTLYSHRRNIKRKFRATTWSDALRLYDRSVNR